MPLIVNGQFVDDHVLEVEMLRLSAGLEMDAPNAGGISDSYVRSMALRNVVDRALLLQTAGSRKMQVTVAEAEQELARRWDVSRNRVCDPGAMETLRQDMLIKRISTELTRHIPRPGRDQAEQFYKAHPDRYRLEEAVEGAHIVCGFATEREREAASAAIADAEAELVRGRPFAKVADMYSDCKRVGGSVGWVTRGTMVQRFEETLFGLQPGTRSGVFETVFGFHIAMCIRWRKEQIVPFNEVRLQIGQELLTTARQQALQQVLATIRARSEIRHTEQRYHG